jgi:predicted transcriptional regulator of viral defense system
MTDAESPDKLLLVTTARLRARNRSPQWIETMVRRGRLVRVGRGVYVRADIGRTFGVIPDGEHILQTAAAVVQAGRGSVVSHRSAAVLHGIDLIGRPGDVVTITGLSGGGRKGSAKVHRYTTPLPPERVSYKYGVPVITVARTVIDLARTTTFVEGVVAADSAIRTRRTSKSELRAVIATSPRRRGVAEAARVVEFATGLAGPSRALPSTISACPHRRSRSGSRRPPAS